MQELQVVSQDLVLEVNLIIVKMMEKYPHFVLDGEEWPVLVALLVKYVRKVNIQQHLRIVLIKEL